MLILAAACGSDSGSGSAQPVSTAATLGAQTILTATEYLDMAPYAEADRAHGRRLAHLCAACHTFEAGGRTIVGPNLYGFFGRKAGTRAGFDYSNALTQADFVWTPRALNAWLAEPARFLPGNRMSFVGIADADDRADLIAYLLEVADSKETQSSEGAQ